MDEPLSRLLTAAEVAQLLNVEKATVYEAVAKGRLPAVRLWRGTRRSLLRFRRQDIETAVSERVINSPAR